MGSKSQGGGGSPANACLFDLFPFSKWTASRRGARPTQREENSLPSPGEKGHGHKGQDGGGNRKAAAPELVLGPATRLMISFGSILNVTAADISSANKQEHESNETASRAGRLERNRARGFAAGRSPRRWRRRKCRSGHHALNAECPSASTPKGHACTALDSTQPRRTSIGTGHQDSGRTACRLGEERRLQARSSSCSSRQGGALIACECALPLAPRPNGEKGYRSRRVRCSSTRIDARWTIWLHWAAQQQQGKRASWLSDMIIFYMVFYFKLNTRIYNTKQCFATLYTKSARDRHHGQLSYPTKKKCKTEFYMAICTICYIQPYICFFLRQTYF